MDDGQDEHAPSPVEPRDHAEVWVADSDDPTDHQHLRFALEEAARAVATLRAEGRRVLLHCVGRDVRTAGTGARTRDGWRHAIPARRCLHNRVRTS